MNANEKLMIRAEHLAYGDKVFYGETLTLTSSPLKIGGDVMFQFAREDGTAGTYTVPFWFEFESIEMGYRGW